MEIALKVSGLCQQIPRQHIYMYLPLVPTLSSSSMVPLKRDVYWLDMMNQDLEDENYELLEMVMDAQQEEKTEQKTTDAQLEVKDAEQKVEKAEQKVEKAEQKVKVVDDPSDFIECVQSTAVYIDQPTNMLDAKRLTY
eukprot:Em0003g1677a